VAFGPPSRVARRAVDLSVVRDPVANSRDAGAFLRWIARGKSARRALLNLELARCQTLQGSILDLGGGPRSSYADTLPRQDTKIVVVDLVQGGGVSVVADATALPFRSKSVNAVLCFNVLEHVYDYRTVLAEARRVLRLEGVMYGYVPFVCNVHTSLPECLDYWRFTPYAITRSLRDAGFRAIEVRGHGGPFLSCFDLTSYVLRFTALKVAAAAVGLLADSWLRRLRPDVIEQYRGGYFFLAQ